MKFLTCNSPLYRTLRTIVQGIIGVAIANIDTLIASLSIPDTMRPIIVALCMAILSPIMAEIGRAQENQNAKAVGLIPDNKEVDYENSTRDEE